MVRGHVVGAAAMDNAAGPPSFQDILLASAV